MPAVNHIWAANVLNMEVNPGKGPDLIGVDRNIELKFCLVPPAKNYIHWTTFEYQIAYAEKKSCLWGVGTYRLDRPIEEIKTSNPSKLEEYVTNRELFLVNWDWIYLFKPHELKGETNISSWEHTLRYPRFNALPKVVKTYSVLKGRVHITKGVRDSVIQ